MILKRRAICVFPSGKQTSPPYETGTYVTWLIESSKEYYVMASLSSRSLITLEANVSEFRNNDATYLYSYSSGR
jgi:hypothetical protein